MPITIRGVGTARSLREEGKLKSEEQGRRRSLHIKQYLRAENRENAFSSSPFWGGGGPSIGEHLKVALYLNRGFPLGGSLLSNN